MGPDPTICPCPVGLSSEYATTPKKMITSSLVFDLPKNIVQNTRKSPKFGEEERSGVNFRMKIYSGLQKRGMKFAHVNIATLPGHSADVDVLLANTSLDVFAVAESRLDSTIPDSQVCPMSFFATERIEIEMGAIVRCLSRVNGLLSGGRI